MLAYVIRRVLVNIVVFFFISIAIFLLVRAAPGDPVRMMVNPEQIQASGPEFIAAKRAELGLDDGVAVQYARWLGNALSGDLGFSFVSQRPVLEVLGERLGPSVLLMGTALAIGLLIAIPVGIVAAKRKNSFVDYLAAILSLGTISVPSFFIGIAGISVFALTLGWLPSAGMSTPGLGGPDDILRHLILPASILGLLVAGPFVRYVRGAMLTELSADYVRTAEAKGAAPPRVLFRHALRNALIPIITVVMIYIPQMLSGTVVLEQVFAWPGLGQLAVSSTGQLDYPVVVGFALFVGALVLLCNLVADLLCAAVDPRIRLR